MLQYFFCVSLEIKKFIIDEVLIGFGIKTKTMKKIKKVLNKDIFEMDHNEEGRFAILLSLMPLLVLTFFMNFGIV